MSNLSPRINADPVSIKLKAVRSEGRGFVVARNLGIVDALEVSLFKLKPKTMYSVYLAGQASPVANFITDAMGAANGSVIGPVKSYAGAQAQPVNGARRIVVMEGDAKADPNQAVLVDTI